MRAARIFVSARIAGAEALLPAITAGDGSFGAAIIKHKYDTGHTHTKKYYFFARSGTLAKKSKYG